MMPLRFRYVVPLAVLFGAGAAGCGGDSTGAGGVLIVSRVDVSGGSAVLIGGTLQLQATPRTSTGIAVPGKPVAWSSSNASVASVSPAGVVAGSALGSAVISATVDGITGEVTVEVRRVPVASVLVTAPATTLEAGQTMQVQAITLDSVGGVLTGRAITWASSSPAAATISANGLVSALGAGTTTISASSEGQSGSVVLTITPQPANRLGFLVPPSNSTAGEPISPAIQVALRDEAGNTVPTATGTVTLALAANPGSATLTGTLTAQAAQGIATFTNIRVNRAGQGYTLQATSPGFTSAVSSAFNIVAGAPAALALAIEPSGGSATGAALAQQPVVQLRDAQGNDARQSGVTVTASLASGLGTLNGTTTAVTGADGRAVFTNLAINGSLGTYTLRFEATSLSGVTSSPFTVGAGAATQLTFSVAPPTSAVNGQLLAPPVVLQLRDGSGNAVAQSGTLITANLQSGTGALGGTLAVATGAGGSATFSDLVITGVAGNFTLRFSAAGVTAATSAPIAVQAGPASQVLFDQAPPASAINGQPLASSTVVRLADVGGNLVTTNGVSVTTTLASGPGGGVLTGTTTRVTAGGLATFDDLVLTGPAGNYTLDFSAGSLTKATSNPIALQAGTATKLVFATSPPASGESGTALSPAPVIQLQDVNSNSVTDAGVTVTVSRVSGNASVVLSGNSAITDANGRATFSSLTLTGPADDYVLAFLSPGLTGVTSSTITVSAGSATKLGFVTPPSTTASSGLALAQQPVVQLLDAADNPVQQAGREITLGLTGGGALDATSLTVTTDVSGQAEFTGVTITGLVGDRTLTFSGAGLSALASGTITLGPGTATALAMVTEPPAAVGEAETFSSAPSVQLVDAAGNPVDSAGVTIEVTVTPAGATLDGTTTQATGAGGSASFPGLSLTGDAGDYVLEFSGSGLTGVNSSKITLTVPAGISVTTEPAGAVNLVPLGTQPEVAVTDAGAVGLAGITVVASLVTVSGPAGTLLGTTTQVTGAGGVASWTNLAIQKAVLPLLGEYAIVFTTANGVTTQSATITVP